MLLMFSINNVDSLTTELRVSVIADDSIGPLGGMEDTPPGQGTGVAQLWIIVQQN